MPGDTRAAQQVIRDLDARGYRSDGLAPVGVRPGLDEYFAQLWARRHFIWMDSRHRVLAQNSRNRLGNVWLLLRPLMDAAFYFLIFGVLLNMASRSVDNFAAFIIIGVLMFRATASSLTSAPNTLVSGRAMIRAFSFPRAAIPISAVLRDGMQMIWTVGAMLVMIMALPPHELPSLTWPLIIPVLVLQWMLNMGLTLLVARIGLQVPDLSQLMTFISRVLMYTSGVIFPVGRFLENYPTAQAISELNPVYQMLVMYRGILQDGTAPALESWLILGAWSGGLLIVGFLYFWRGEATYGGGQ